MSVRRRLKGKKIPPAFSQIEEVIEDFEAQMRDAVAADHAGKRRAESAWAVHRIHWEKNRFIHDLMYTRKAMDRGLFDWLVREKVADGALISKWRKPGYEILCSMLAIQKSGHNFGTTSHCR
jgi:bud site selection protein 31